MTKPSGFAQYAPWSVSTFISFVTGRDSPRIVPGAGVGGGSPGSATGAGSSQGGRAGIGPAGAGSNDAHTSTQRNPGRTSARFPSRGLPGVISRTSGSAARRHDSPSPWPSVTSLSTGRWTYAGSSSVSQTNRAPPERENTTIASQSY